ASPCRIPESPGPGPFPPCRPPPPAPRSPARRGSRLCRERGLPSLRPWIVLRRTDGGTAIVVAAHGLRKARPAGDRRGDERPGSVLYCADSCGGRATCQGCNVRNYDLEFLKRFSMVIG